MTELSTRIILALSPVFFERLIAIIRHFLLSPCSQIRAYIPIDSGVVVTGSSRPQLFTLPKFQRPIQLGKSTSIGRSLWDLVLCVTDF